MTDIYNILIVITIVFFVKNEKKVNKMHHRKIPVILILTMCIGAIYYLPFEFSILIVRNIKYRDSIIKILINHKNIRKFILAYLTHVYTYTLASLRASSVCGIYVMFIVRSLLT